MLTPTGFTLTGFTDEALAPWSAQMAMAARGHLTHVELRRLGPRSALEASSGTVDRAAHHLAVNGLKVSCIASGIGKAPVDAPLGPQLDALRRAAALAHRFHTPFVRTFSWFTTTPDADRARVLDQMVALADTADTLGVTLLHENEKGIFGDTPDRCLELVDATDGRLRLIFDPANFVQCGVRPVDEALPKLADHVAYLHAKDASARTHRVTPVGDGDGQWRELVTRLAASGWSGFVSLEPHLGGGGRGLPITQKRWLGALESLRSVLP